VIREVARPACTACGRSGAPLYEGLRDNLFDAAGAWSLVKCTNPACALLWLNPAPHPDDLPLLYQGYYTHGDEVGSRGLRAARAVHRMLVNCLLAPLGIPLEQARARRMFIDRKVPGSLLDIGCGDGRFLSVMARRGWRVAGVDFDAAAVAQARELRKLDVKVGTAASQAALGEKYDRVTASHVIEHVAEPREFLRHCRQLLTPGGRIILCTPNARSFGHRRYGAAWRGLEPPRHLQLFTLAALSSCAQQAGLQVESAFTTIAEAQAILVVSHFLRKRGACRLPDFSMTDLLEWSVVGPVLAARARWAWWADPASGEELYVILAPTQSPVS
jgi:2-polyprenyl-3-methyl-5-hydroxy-6-metoxy-1,4-benzoquinol methylase